MFQNRAWQRDQTGLDRAAFCDTLYLQPECCRNLFYEEMPSGDASFWWITSLTDFRLKSSTVFDVEAEKRNQNGRF